MTHASPERERGAVALSYLALGVLAAVILASLVTLGIGDRFAAGANAVVCRTVQADGSCPERPAAQAPTEPAKPGKPAKPPGKPAKDGGCHGFWGCAWSGTKHVGGGAWGGVKDTGSGLKSLVTTNPVTTGKALGTFFWHESPIGQGVRAWKACGAQQWGECGDAVVCTVVSTGCLVRDTVIDDKTRDDLAKHRWGDASGRVLWNGGSLFLPTKIPGLGKLGDLGKAGKGAEDAGDAAKAGRTAARPHQGRAAPDMSRTYRGAEKSLRKARRGAGGHLAFPKIQQIIGEFEKLDAAERAKFIDGLSTPELRDIWDAAPRIDRNLRSDLTASASPQALEKLDERPPFRDSGDWYTFTGDLWRDTGPTPWDVEQGLVGDCWCMSPMEALAEQAPERIERMFTKNPNGTYTITFGTGRRVTVTPELPRNGAHVYDEAGWPALLEKAIAAHRGGYDAITDGGHADDTLHLLLGNRTYYYASKSTMPDVETIATSLRDHDALVLGIDEDAKLPDAENRGITFDHDYVVTEADPKAKTITLANPHSPSRPEVVLTENELHTLDGLHLFRGVTTE